MDYSKTDGDKVDISSVLNTSAGDHLDVIKNADGSVKLEILNSGNIEKASVSFEISIFQISLQATNLIHYSGRWMYTIHNE